MAGTISQSRYGEKGPNGGNRNWAKPMKPQGECGPTFTEVSQESKKARGDEARAKTKGENPVSLARDPMTTDRPDMSQAGAPLMRLGLELANIIVRRQIYPDLSPEASSMRAQHIGAVLVAELRDDARDFPDSERDTLTPGDLAAMAAEAAHYGRIALHVVGRRYCACGDRLWSARELREGSCNPCRWEAMAVRAIARDPGMPDPATERTGGKCVCGGLLERVAGAATENCESCGRTFQVRR